MLTRRTQHCSAPPSWPRSAAKERLRPTTVGRRYEGGVGNHLVHNHPSGDPTPSRENLLLTRQLAEGARLLDLRLHDHLIIGNGTEQWVSLAQRGGL